MLEISDEVTEFPEVSCHTSCALYIVPQFSNTSLEFEFELMFITEL